MKRQATFVKLVADGKTVGVFPAHRTTKHHRELARLKGFHFQPALKSEYLAFQERHGRP